MKPLFTLLTVLFIATSGFSQDVVSQYEVNDTFEGQAQKLTASYDAELGLQADQRILFQKKVEEYLILSQEAKDQLKGREKLEKLYRLQLDEIADMSEILTRIQFNKYKKIRPDMQPLDVAKMAKEIKQ
ncbi:MAG: hypothetical protein CMC74_03360 [Flavobacteriaceae bacterium]|nr:hypothetical protein [Flavobacteriaceae bacterium]|tara:strand:- start:16853 stop:17239 length:387 start_codon:yes stop_codon:yes gene_type:complete